MFDTDTHAAAICSLSPRIACAATADASTHDAYSTQLALAAITIRLPKNKSEGAAAATATSLSAITSIDVPMPFMHLLPCRIAHTGPAAVSHYFRPTVTTTAVSQSFALGADGSVIIQSAADTAKQQSYDARFRGRQITGSIIDLTVPLSTANKSSNAWLQQQQQQRTCKGFVFEEDENRAIELDAEDESAAMDDTADASAARRASQPQSHYWRAAATFDSFVLWAPDTEMRERHVLTEAVHDWREIARAIHDPLE